MKHSLAWMYLILYYKYNLGVFKVEKVWDEDAWDVGWIVWP